MNECNAAMILVTLSHSPKSPKNGERAYQSTTNLEIVLAKLCFYSWNGFETSSTMARLASTQRTVLPKLWSLHYCFTFKLAIYSTQSQACELENKWLGSSPGSSSASWSSGSSSPPLSDDGHNISAHMINDASASARIRTTSVSTSDEGIVVDFKEDVPRKKRVEACQLEYKH
uniref:Uncharacterized protein n=1 Tax=Glossina austeni TaxID=7395 RepID=A0A1A9V6U4_GLOAU